MKSIFEIDARLPDTVRISTEWRVSFRLSRYSMLIREIRLSVRAPYANSDSHRYECQVWVALIPEGRVHIQENAANAPEAVAAAVDRAAASIARFARRQSRLASMGNTSGPGSRISR